jgi:hypothetical protein
MIGNSDSAIAPAAMRRPMRGCRHRKSSLVSRILAEHSRRLVSFSLIGFGVFLVSVCFQALLVREFHMPTVSAYVAQLILSIQANFSLIINGPGAIRMLLFGALAGVTT